MPQAKDGLYQVTTKAPQDVITEADREILLTVKEYAYLFRRHQQTIYMAIRRGTLPFAVERPSGGYYMIRLPRGLAEKLRARIA